MPNKSINVMKETKAKEDKSFKKLQNFFSVKHVFCRLKNFGLDVCRMLIKFISNSIVYALAQTKPAFFW